MAWPNALAMEKDDWFSQVQTCAGVVVPMLSVASLSRVCSLAPDTPATNIILHALFMGKPVVAAIDGVAPVSPDRRTLGLDKGTPALMTALARRLVEFSDFGAWLTWGNNLGSVGLRAIGAAGGKKADPMPASAPPSATPLSQPVAALTPAAVGGGALRLVDSGKVRQARHRGEVIHTAPGAVVTPLARELALGWGIEIKPVSQASDTWKG
jgi:hypothetical protein